jgi:hypothetical protein
MKTNRIAAILLGLTLVLTGFTSCKKCLKCRYVEEGTLVPREREDCGNRDQLDKFKNDVIKEAKAFGLVEEDVRCEYQ